MKRRTFLTASSTVGMVGVIPGVTIASSVYSNINTSILLEEFNPTTKNALDKLMAEVTLNTQALGLDKKFAAQVAMPVQIISKNSKDGNQSITYKNTSGEYISLSVTKGVERIEVLKTL